VIISHQTFRRVDQCANLTDRKLVCWRIGLAHLLHPRDEATKPSHVSPSLWKAAFALAVTRHHRPANKLRCQLATGRRFIDRTSKQKAASARGVPETPPSSEHWQHADDSIMQTEQRRARRAAAAAAVYIVLKLAKPMRVDKVRRPTSSHNCNS